jgi:hypothetical protein
MRGRVEQGGGQAAGQPAHGPFAARSAALALVFLPVALFVRQVADGLLSDDFLYAGWARQSFATLLAHVSVASYPQMLRPVVAPFWLLAGSAAGVGLMHLLSLLVHGANGALLWVVARRLGSPPGVALMVALLFLTFPLSGEAVLWLSGAFDLWATALVLLALVAGEGVGRRSAALAGASLFLAALLCKESAFCVPLALVVLPRPERLRRLWPLAVSAAVYLAVRLALFGGLGGYVQEAPRQPLSLRSAAALARAVALQVPARVLVPIADGKPAMRAAILVLSALLLVAFVGSTFRARGVAAAAAAFVVAALPAASVLRVEWDLQGARLIYLPLLIGLLVLSVFARPGGSTVGAGAGAGLVVWWAILAVHDAHRWSEAGATVRRTLNAMSLAEPLFPARATVLVDALDSFAGAYVFRNGLVEAALREGLRRDLRWQRGTPAGLPPALRADLGTSLFALGVDREGRPKDRTSCYRLLSVDAAPEGATAAGGAAAPAKPVRSSRDLGRGGGLLEETSRASSGAAVFGPLRTDERGSCSVVTLANGCAFEPAAQKLFWKTGDEGPFESMRSAVVRTSVERGSTVRVPLWRDDGTRGALWLRLDPLRSEQPSCLAPTRVEACPPPCR